MKITQHSNERIKKILFEIALNPDLEQKDLPTILGVTYKTMLNYLNTIRDCLFIEEFSVLSEKNVHKNRFRITLSGLLELCILEPNTLEKLDEILSANNYQISQYPYVPTETNSNIPFLKKYNLILSKWRELQRFSIPEELRTTEAKENKIYTLKDIIKKEFLTVSNRLNTNILSEEFNLDLLFINELLFDGFVEDSVFDFLDIFSIAENNYELDKPMQFILDSFSKDTELSNLFEDYLFACQFYLRDVENTVKGLTNYWNSIKEITAA